ncbi:MAG TPA: methylated-DNA--[protein]-cysteine S-methyltransferase [Methylocystis sp.]|nr:methylated-DNA--[protein]-cysteine S-methyltransferase [Methylocystis sp.]
MPPLARNGRQDVRYAVGTCSLGAVIVAAEGERLCALWFGDAPADLIASLRKRFPQARAADDADMSRLLARAVDLVERPHVEWREPLALAGTPFQLKVWTAMCEIPTGETASYAEIARRIGRPTAARAVAAACAANPIAIVVPCHRVIHSDGSISGYAAGVERKRVLLQREALHRAARAAA